MKEPRMTPEQSAAYLNAAVARAIIEALGMVAENTWRMITDETVSYVEADFCELIDKHGIGPMAVAKLLLGC